MAAPSLRAERFVTRAFAAEAKIAALIALCARMDTGAEEGQYDAYVTTAEIRAVLEATP